MATTNLKGTEINTVGELPPVGGKAPEFTLTDGKLEDIRLAHFLGKRKLLNIFPSIDTPVCALSTKKFNDYAREHDNTVMLMISADLPFAQSRFCRDEDLENVIMLSMMRDKQFGDDYGVLLEDGPLAGVLARAVIVLDENNTVVHKQLVPEIGEEPDYQAALKALGAEIVE